jgi:hypothetical protein
MIKFLEIDGFSVIQEFIPRFMLLLAAEADDSIADSYLSQCVEFLYILLHSDTVESDQIAVGVAFVFLFDLVDRFEVRVGREIELIPLRLALLALSAPHFLILSGYYKHMHTVYMTPLQPMTDWYT